MEAYQNKSGQSGVVFYEIGWNFIKIKFQGNNANYLYNYQIPGPGPVEIMKTKAITGIGLTTFINQHVGDNYFSKE